MNITVLGAGKSGIAAALLAYRKNNTVFLSEYKQPKGYEKEIEILKEKDISYEFGGHTEAALEKTDIIITSPGIPPHAPILLQAHIRSIPIISELEYARTFLPNTLIAITGTNGKTTTTTLIAYILNNAGKKAITAGNIGTPLSDLVDMIDEKTIIVTETSSYQLDGVKDFRPDIAIILNITPDHLAYHGSMENYIKAKFKISMNQTAHDLLILNADDVVIAANTPSLPAIVQYFSMQPMQHGAYKKGNCMVLKSSSEHKEEEIMVFDDMRLPGEHNAQNALAAALAVRALEVSNEDIRDSLMKFSGVVHRLEYVRTYKGAEYVNDSKATNVNAAWYALSSYTKPIIWIAGGRGDNNDYSALNELVKNNVRCMITIGEEADALFNHFCTITRCIHADTLEQAVQLSAEYADESDIVLFSPACKSFDMFMNYEHRGEIFKQAVSDLP